MVSHDVIEFIQISIPFLIFVLFFSGLVLWGVLALMKGQSQTEVSSTPTPVSVAVLWSLAFGLALGTIVGSMFEKPHSYSLPSIVGGLVVGLLMALWLFKQYRRFEGYFHRVMTCLRQQA